MESGLLLACSDFGTGMFSFLSIWRLSDICNGGEVISGRRMDYRLTEWRHLIQCNAIVTRTNRKMNNICCYLVPKGSFKNTMKGMRGKIAQGWRSYELYDLCFKRQRIYTGHWKFVKEPIPAQLLERKTNGRRSVLFNVTQRRQTQYSRFTNNFLLKWRMSTVGQLHLLIIAYG